jgi:alpha-glucosidase/alpha-D-xyloside xylohydrolase
MNKWSRLAIAFTLFASIPTICQADGLQYAGNPAALTIQQVSERTVKVVLAPLDAQGQPRPAPPSTALVAPNGRNLLTIRKLDDAQVVNAGELRCRIQARPLSISLSTGSGKLVQEVSIADDGSCTFHTDAPVLGLGEGAAQFDRRGNQFRMLNGQRAPFLATHGGTIPVPFLIGTDGWALFIQSPWGEFDLREGKGLFKPRSDALGKEPLQVFITQLREPADALAEYTRLSGKAVMPPRWVLGYMQSHRTLADSDEPVQIAKTFRDKQLPCDAVIYLGTGYCPAGWNLGHGTFEFNPKTFAHPEDSIKKLHDLNLKVVLHINHAPRNLFGASVNEASDARNHIHNYWARHHELMKLGVDGWWPDDGDELPIEARLARHRCYFEGPLEDRPNERPWALHRNGYAGAQRYGGWIWSGDVQSQWATLAAHVPVGVNHSLSLTPFWGTDIGGFVPTQEFTGELYARWFQFAAFTPLFRSHGRTWKLRLPWGWNTGEFGPVESRSGPPETELHNAAIEPICRKYLELRYKLLSYNYALIREACDSGLPPMRALWLHYPDDPEAVKLGDEYLWGHDLLVAPVTTKGAVERKLYLPEGDWYDFWTGERQPGKRLITRVVDLATLPLYVRAGAIVPLEPVRQYVAQKVEEPATVRIYSGKDGQFRWYEDDGHTLDYQNGKFSWTRLSWDDRANKLTIEPDAATGALAAAPKALVVEVMPQGKKQTVKYEGKRLEIQF